MEIIKVGIVIVTGLGSTWVARQATDAWLDPSNIRHLVQAQPEGAQGAPDAESGSQPAESTAPKPAMPEMTREEMEEELRRAQEELAGDAKGSTSDKELREFKPTKPLPADLPIALPSDI